MVWLGLGPHHGDSHIQGSRCGDRAFKGRLGVPKSSYGYHERYHRCPRSGHGCPGGVELLLGLHQEYQGMVKLVIELHYVSQGANQGELDGGANMWASPCEFR